MDRSAADQDREPGTDGVLPLAKQAIHQLVATRVDTVYWEKLFRIVAMFWNSIVFNLL